MEWYYILTLVLTCIVTLASLFSAYKTRVITNFKELFDKDWNEEDLEAIADLLNITVDAVIKFLKIFGINIEV
jgi:hypothetical protein